MYLLATNLYEKQRVTESMGIPEAFGGMLEGFMCLHPLLVCKEPKMYTSKCYSKFRNTGYANCATLSPPTFSCLFRWLKIVTCLPVYFISVIMNVALHPSSASSYSCENVLGRVTSSIVLLLRPLSTMLQACVIATEVLP